MEPYCAVEWCKTAFSDGLAHHNFPQDPVLCLKWIERCGSPEYLMMDKTQLQRMCVCSRHFPFDFSTQHLEPLPLKMENSFTLKKVACTEAETSFTIAYYTQNLEVVASFKNAEYPGEKGEWISNKQFQKNDKKSHNIIKETKSSSDSQKVSFPASTKTLGYSVIKSCTNSENTCILPSPDKGVSSKTTITINHQSRKDSAQDQYNHKNLFSTATKQTTSLLKFNNKPVNNKVNNMNLEQFSGCSTPKPKAKKFFSINKNSSTETRYKISAPKIEELLEIGCSPNSSKNIQDEFKNLCRTCGKEHHDMTEFFSQNGIAIKLKEKIKIVLSTEVTDSDNRPIQMCTPCISSLEQAYTLKMNSDSAEKMFQDIIERNNQMEIGQTSPDCWDNTGDIQIDEIVEEAEEENAPSITPTAFSDDFIETCKMTLHQLHCPRCPQQFQNIHDFLIHHNESKHKLPIKAFCVKCAIFFKSKFSMLDHVSEIHPNSKESDALLSVSLQAINYAKYGLVARKIMCPLCSQIFMTRGMLRHHRRKSHKVGVKYKICDECGVSCPGINAYKRHIKTHIPKEDAQLKFRCQCCGSKFARNKELIEHIRQEHTGTAAEYKCDICSKVFDLKASLKSHTKFVHCEQVLCDICGKHLKSQNSLKIHKLIHAAGNDSKTIPCEICLRFIPVPLLVQHVQRHFSKYPHSCLKCGSNFTTLNNLQEHMEIHLNPGQAKKCPICTLQLGSNAQLIHHKKKHIHVNGSYFCPICDEHFMSVLATSVHTKEKHRQEEFIAYCATLEKMYECSDCNGIFKSPKELERHKRELRCNFNRDIERNKILSCKFCTHVSQDISGYVSHLKTHPEAFSAKCQYCEDRFKNGRSFKSHEQLHMVDPTGKFKCEICGACLASKNSLNTHLKIHDSNTFQCPLCHKIFATKKNLEQHKRTHLPADTFQCDICRKGFKMKYLLLSHMREKHQEPAKYSCDQCLYVCNRMHQLLAHQRKGGCDPNVIYTCDVCDKTCKSKVSLKQHKSVHNSR